MPLKINPSTGKLDLVNKPISSPFTPQGGITISSDFPTLADVQNGWWYEIKATVTDNDASKTNTGQSFEAGDEIYWNGTDWTVCGNENIYLKLDCTNDPLTGDLEISKADPEIRLTDTGNDEYTRIVRSDTLNKMVIHNKVDQPSSTADQIPAMTSNTTPSGVSSASSVHSSGAYPAWDAFNDTQVGGLDAWISNTVGATEWLQYQFTSTKKTTKYTLRTRPGGVYAPDDWSFQGSNNGSDWTTLDTQTGQASGWSANVKKDFTLSEQSDAYLYYRLYITGFSSSIVAIGEFEIINENPTSEEANVVTSEDGVLEFEKGIHTFGDEDGRTVIEGKTIRFNIDSSEVGQIDTNGDLLWDNSIQIDDDESLFLGTASDTSLTFTGGNLVINPKEVGTGVVSVLGDIHTTDPSSDITIKPSTAQIEIDSGASADLILDKGATNRGADIIFKNAGSAGWTMGMADSDFAGDGTDFRIGRTSGNPDFFIDRTNANVGIGITPEKKLHVYDGTVDYPFLIESSDTKAGLILEDNSGQNGFIFTEAGTLKLGTTINQGDITINSDGNVLFEGLHKVLTMDGLVGTSTLNIQGGNSDIVKVGFLIDDGTERSSIGNDADENLFFDTASSTDDIIWTQGTTTRLMTLTGSGDLIIPNGNVGIGTTNPLAELHTTKGRIKGTTRVTTTYTILVTENIIFANTDGGAYTVTLPAGVEGQELRIINSGTSGNDLTLAPNGAELLTGANASRTMSDGTVVILVYNATDGWY